MKTGLSILFFSLFILSSAIGQLDPVQWSFASEKIGEGEYKVKFTAEVEDGWAIYSQFTAEGGPIPTSFAIEESKSLELVDAVVEPEDKETKYDEMFEMDVMKLKGSVEFYQIIRSKTEKATVKGFVTYMCCDDSKCLPPTDVNFAIAIE